MSSGTDARDLVAVIPAAGGATRVSELPFSKSLYPLPVRESGRTTVHTPLGRVLRSLRRAGAGRALIVTRPGKSDLIECAAGLSVSESLPVAMVVTSTTPSVPNTILRAVPFFGSADVLLAYPDIVFEPMDLPALLVARRTEREADIMLALVPTDHPERSDTVELDGENRVVRIAVKSKSGLPESWVMAVWNLRFTEFLSGYVAAQDKVRSSTSPELQVAEIFLAAQAAGLSLLGERFTNGRFLDLGTPDALVAAASFLSWGQHA